MNVDSWDVIIVSTRNFFEGGAATSEGVAVVGPAKARSEEGDKWCRFLPQDAGRSRTPTSISPTVEQYWSVIVSSSLPSM